MHDHAIIHVIATGLTTAFIIGIIYVVSAIGKGLRKFKGIRHLRGDEICKVDYIVERISHIDISPKIGKAEYIKFYLDPNDESAFYAISPKYLKQLRPRLEKLASKFEQTESSYGHKYAERSFFIGETLIFSWKNEVKI